MPRPMVSLSERRLHYFHAALTAGSMRAAAERLGVEASVISRQIQLLEKELNVTLIERRGRGVAPTDAGRLVLQAYEERCLVEETLRLRLDELRGLERGELTIVTGEGFVRELMSKVMAAFCARYPGINVQMETVRAEEAVAHVVEDRAHLGWTLCPPAHPAVRIVHERPQPLCAIMAAAHPLAGPAARVSLAAVAQYPLALAPAGTGLRALTHQAEVADGIRLNAVFSANSIDALMHYVGAGLGVTFLSVYPVERELAAGVLVARRTTNAVLERAKAQLFVRRGRRYSAAVQAFFAQMRQSGLF